MTVYHDAYLFSADAFIAFLQTHLPIITDDAHTQWMQLTDKTLEFAQDSFVDELSDIYGSWDYEGLKNEFAYEIDDKLYLAKHSFMVFLYKYLAQFEKHPNGLGDHWHTIEKMTKLSDMVKQLIVYGHPLNELLANNLHDKSVFALLFNQTVKPHSTASWAGYLDYDDLVMINATVQKAIQSSKDKDHQAMSEILRLSQSAIRAKMGLCLIASG